MAARAVRRTHLSHQPFKVARKFARSLKLKSQEQWREYVRTHWIPPGIPAKPGRIYREEWRGWPDFLAVKRVKAPRIGRDFMSFEKARALTREKGFHKPAEYLLWTRKPRTSKGLPRTPSQVYRGRWRGWRDFLGQNYAAGRSRKTVLPFNKARALVRSLKLKSSTEFLTWTQSKKCSSNMAKLPYQTYSKDWKGWPDFLGSSYADLRTARFEEKQKRMKSFKALQATARKAGFENSQQYLAWARKQPRSAGVTVYPASRYPTEWKGWSDFLGKGFLATYQAYGKQYREIRSALRKTGIRSKTRYLQTVAKDSRKGWPKDPRAYFKGTGWRGWKDFLGLPSKKRQARGNWQSAAGPSVIRITSLSELSGAKTPANQKVLKRGKKSRTGRIAKHSIKRAVKQAGKRPSPHSRRLSRG